ncbi:MAG: hypothetical protein EOM73_10735, partial [Bacteroidia bacterium]|nr:hypothetical protein [Bacteroidia bacterium]
MCIHKNALPVRAKNNVSVLVGAQCFNIIFFQQIQGFRMRMAVAVVLSARNHRGSDRRSGREFLIGRIFTAVMGDFQNIGPQIRIGPKNQFLLLRVNVAGEKKRVVGLVGDSTFFHSGITALLDIGYNKSAPVIII